MSKNESVFHHILNKPKNEKRVDKTSRRETIRDEIWFFLEAGSIVLTNLLSRNSTRKRRNNYKSLSLFSISFASRGWIIDQFNTKNINWQQMTWLKHK